MRGGSERTAVRVWQSGMGYALGERVLPRIPNGHVYEVITQGTARSPEPLWPLNSGGTVSNGCCNSVVVFKELGLEADVHGIGAFPNNQQGFGRLSLTDVLSEYPARVFVNEDEHEASLSVGQFWTKEYAVHDSSLPVRIALVWTDRVPVFVGDQHVWNGPPLVNDLDLSVIVKQGSTPVGRYVGNALGATEESTYYTPATAGAHDRLNNVEVARFFPTPARGDTTFAVNVAFFAGTETQNFALVVWNAYDVTNAPPAPVTNFAASGSGTTAVTLTWAAAARATSYDLQRSTGPNTPYVTIATPTTITYTDTGLSAGTSYLYRIRARNVVGVTAWTADAGTTPPLTDPALTGTKIKAVHISELRQLIAALRAMAGLAPATWTDTALAAGQTRIKAVHVAELRTALNAARTALGLTPIVFSDGTLTPGTMVVKAVHLEELRNGAR